MGRTPNPGLGSTKAPPVVVQASLVSDVGVIVPERLKQLVQTITGSIRRGDPLTSASFPADRKRFLLNAELR
ncbi:hypothetical protein ACFX2G_034962 [Malus domestica]